MRSCVRPVHAVWPAAGPDAIRISTLLIIATSSWLDDNSGRCRSSFRPLVRITALASCSGECSRPVARLSPGRSRAGRQGCDWDHRGHPGGERPHSAPSKPAELTGDPQFRGYYLRFAVALRKIVPGLASHKREPPRQSGGV
jgi:hypothetical protein